MSSALMCLENLHPVFLYTKYELSTNGKLISAKRLRANVSTDSGQFVILENFGFGTVRSERVKDMITHEELS